MRNLGRTLRRVERLSWLEIPGSLPPEGAVKYVGGWWKRIYAQYLASSSCPIWATSWIHKILERLSELPQHFGGWQNQLLADSPGSFVLIDWPVAGADWFASGITSAMALIPQCKSHQPHLLLDQLLAGYSLRAPLTDRECEDSRLMFAPDAIRCVSAAMTRGGWAQGTRPMRRSMLSVSLDRELTGNTSRAFQVRHPLRIRAVGSRQCRSCAVT